MEFMLNGNPNNVQRKFVIKSTQPVQKAQASFYHQNVETNIYGFELTVARAMALRVFLLNLDINLVQMITYGIGRI